MDYGYNILYQILVATPGGPLVPISLRLSCPYDNTEMPQITRVGQTGIDQRGRNNLCPGD